MSNATYRDTSVTGFLLSAALERYQARWDELADHWCDSALFQAANSELAEVRKLIASLPQLSVEMTEVVMRHAQLLRALVRPASPVERRAQVRALKRRHEEAVGAVRRKCLELIAPRGA
jgi:hypothetical protein